MQFADYQDFRVGLQRLIEGDDLPGTFSLNVLDMIIGLGEARVCLGDEQTAGLRASTMVSDLSAAVTSNAATLPADLLELKEVYFSGERPLDIVPLDRLRAAEADANHAGQSRFAAQDGDTIRFWPTASGNVLGSYYAKPDPLEEGLHSTFNRYPELYVFACLAESAPFLGYTDRAAIWESKYRQLSDRANQAERMRVYAGGPMKQRTR